MKVELNINKGKRTFKIPTNHGQLLTPLFMPDATYGAVTSIGSDDLRASGVEALVTTTLHIEQKIGSAYLSRYGGIHNFMDFNKPILTDSGGYQVFSLIHRNKSKNNMITDAGCSFTAEANGQFNFLSPEISQQIQHKIGSDIRVVLDEPVIEDSSLANIKRSVNRTTEWAKRSKTEFLKLHNLTENDFNDPKIDRPLLAAVVQGANNFKYRQISAEQLIDIGFDIYSFGGLPLHSKHSWKNDAPQGFYHELITFVANLLPIDKIRYGLGIGSPDDLDFAYKAGWDIFDCVLPTRNARHAYLYVHKGQGDRSYRTYDVLHIKNGQYQFSKEPVDSECDCLTCKTIDRAYLRYLLKTHNPTGYRYATIHNLTFYSKYIHNLRNA
jgi:queuine tRNA-ribosyltransferase